jgi:hypothetical protein
MSFTEKQMFPLSAQMKDALGTHATSKGKSVSDIIRTAIAKEIGYDLTQDANGGRSNKKYASAEERIAAQKERQKEKNSLVKQLLEAHRAAEEAKRKAEAIRALEGKKK